ncbi:Ran GTPase-activating protein (RanGAP) involved in mRNA processing and transport [Legionella massiliensis]|uniref:Ran GTPase-activating protein (RanGAP) involved in mRNA processing and transport n=1 Tax=Legionella massiliensis TaxID=1034943 RepID=A0A078KR01_9GAMM|nr:hypothetical protein [Legionella massiliensis]CDZ76845.1 Ran GTPase-activating protein (RanGAP) involved in mRNA processing and transport [Legionella massiliensis]CEE12583.1 hypothetical protein BN1094_01121 [Legionella massiliensis]
MKSRFLRDNPFPISGTYESDTSTILDLDEEKLSGELEGMQELNFSDVTITKESLNKISKALCSNESIKSLALSWHKLDDISGNLLFTALKTNQRIVRINLDHVEMSKEDWQSLSDLLRQNTNLSYLRIASCNMVSGEAELFAQGLAINTKLEVLQLRENRINETGGLAIAQALRKNRQLGLTNLAVFGNFGMGSDACIAIMKACRYLRNLKELDLSHNGINDKAPILKLLDECPQLEVFSMESKSLDNPIVRNEVWETIQVNNTRYLRLQYLFAFYFLMKDENPIIATFPKELRNVLMLKFIEIDFKNIEKLRAQYTSIDNSYPQPKERYVSDSGLCFIYPSEEEAQRAFAAIPEHLKVSEEKPKHPLRTVKHDKNTISIGKREGSNTSFHAAGVFTPHKEAVAIDCHSEENAKIMYPLFFSKAVGVHLGTNDRQFYQRSYTIYCENPGIFKKLPKPAPKPAPKPKDEEKCVLQ